MVKFGAKGQLMNPCYTITGNNKKLNTTLVIMNGYNQSYVLFPEIIV